MCFDSVCQWVHMNILCMAQKTISLLTAGKQILWRLPWTLALFRALVSSAEIEWMELSNMHNLTHCTGLTALITERHRQHVMGGAGTRYWRRWVPGKAVGWSNNGAKQNVTGRKPAQVQLIKLCKCSWGMSPSPFLLPPSLLCSKPQSPNKSHIV